MTYKWVLIAWMMLLGGLFCSEEAYSQTMRSTSSAFSSTVDHQAYTPAASTSPAYRFQSTSSYTTVVGSSAYSSTISSPFAANSPMGSSRRTGSYNPWDEDGDPEGEEIGVVNTPIGEPIVLLLMAVLYVFCRRRRKQVA